MPEGGRLTLYAPAATENFTRCAHSCYSFTSADVVEGALTTPPLEGGSQGFMSFVSGSRASAWQAAMQWRAR